MPKPKTRTFGDVIPKIDFHLELPKVSLVDVLDKQYEITDAQVVRDFNSQFGKSDFALLLLTDPGDGTQFTTLCGGMVVVRKTQFALDNRLLPLLGTITFNGNYYDIS